jgi:hypothetical protein
MSRACLLFSAAALLAAIPGSARADPDDYRENRANKVADCKKKLREAQSRREYREKLEECDREIAKFDREWAEKRYRSRREAQRYRDGYD